MRVLSNGHYYIPRPTKSQIEEMNEKYERVAKNRWRDRLAFNEQKDYTILQPYFGNRAYIIAKGKSIDRLTSEHFDPYVPIVCINEAVMLIDSMGLPNLQVGIRQDGKSREYCPSKGYMIVKKDIMSYYHGFKNTIPWVYNKREPMCTLALGLHIVNALGVKEVTIYGADIHTSNEIAYSDCAPKADHKVNPYPLDKQLQSLKQQSKGMNCKWVKSDLENWIMEL